MDRRAFLRHSILTLGASCVPSAAPAGNWAQRQAPSIITRDNQRPAVTYGVQSGDVVADRAVVWSRTDRPARLIVEYDTTDRFTNPRRVRGPVALDVTDFTARLELTGLRPGQDVFYRVHFEDLSDLRTSSEPVVGHLRTASATPRDVLFVWSADTCGQGFGINPEWGGLRAYDTMRQRRPDFFVHCGDTIYADGPITAEVAVENGRIWKNVVTEAKSKVAETLEEFRGNYRYNLLDDHVRRFNADVPQIWQWDDHEVLNNWSPGTDLSMDRRYGEKRVGTLSARASRAFLEYAPLRRQLADDAQRVYRRIPYGPLLDVFVLDMRSYRAGNSHNRQEMAGNETVLLGSTQIEWLIDGLRRSRATWKVIACDMPLGLPVADGQDASGRPRFEAVANGDSGRPSGREFEIARLLRAMKASRVRNVIWLTGDVHYTAAHYYSPSNATFTDFDPFWEFVSGPLHAGGAPAAPALDGTFGPIVKFQKLAGTTPASPFLGMLFFGEVSIEARTRALTVRLKDLENVTHFSTTLDPEPVP